jgi:hypothetical protein
VNVLLDENFPLGLLHRLRADGFIADHIITLGWRGASDAQIRRHLQTSDKLFLTQDDDFLTGERVPAMVMVSHVRQARPLADRIEVWRTAVHSLVQSPQTARLFELSDDGVLLPHM